MIAMKMLGGLVDSDAGKTGSRDDAIKARGEPNNTRERSCSFSRKAARP